MNHYVNINEIATGDKIRSKISGSRVFDVFADALNGTLIDMFRQGHEINNFSNTTEF